MVEFTANSKTYFGQVADLQGASEGAAALLQTLQEQGEKLVDAGPSGLLRPFINRLDEIPDDKGLRAALKTFTERIEAQTPVNVKQAVESITKLKMAAIKDPIAVPTETVERISKVLGDALTTPQKAAPVAPTSLLSSIFKVFRGAMTLLSVGNTLQEQRNINANYQHQNPKETTEVGLPSIHRDNKKMNYNVG